MTRNMTNSPHHHGNLRQALIDAGLQLLEAGGPAALTLRKCAAIAGVSHAAPANHFNGLISLKVAIIARGHVIFAQCMRESSAAANPSPRDQLNAICEGYVTFARDHRRLFQFMFQFLGSADGEIDETSLSEKRQAASASYEILRQACIPFEHNNNDALNTETMVWSLVHGYAMLFSVEQGVQPPDQAIPEFSEILPPLTLRKGYSQ